MTPKNIIVHHTGGSDAAPLADSSNYTLQQCEADHKARFNFKSSLGYYTGYAYFMDKAGKIIQTRTDTEEAAACVGYNNNKADPAKNRSINICLAGNFDATLPTQAQVDSLKAFLTSKIAQYGIPLENIVPHRTYAKKTCYGNKLSNSWARDLIKPTLTLESLDKRLTALENKK